MDRRAFEITPARSPAEFCAAALLFKAYASSIGIDLAYQGFDQELATLPGRYAPPGGELLLAHNADRGAIGCVAMRPLHLEGCCEMKRLYVSRNGRGAGIGRALVDAIVDAGTRIGYRAMCLDTLPTMTDAIALYKRMGFEPMDAYYETPVAGTIFLKRTLRD